MDISPYRISFHFLCWKGAKNLIFCIKLEIVVLGRNVMVYTRKCLHMLLKAPPFIFMHLRKVMKYSSSNGCLFLQRSIIFSMLRGCPRVIILLEIWECFWQKSHGAHHKCLVYDIRSPSNYLYTSEEMCEILNNQWISLLTAYRSISCAERVPKIWSFA